MTAAGTEVDASEGGVAVVTRGLTKRFRSGQHAVVDLGLVVPYGAVYGFLGPNGSGKTTTIRLLLGLLQPTAGERHVLGRSIPEHSAAVLPRVGALVEGPAFHPYLSGVANLQRLDVADRTSDPMTANGRIGEALERVGLTAAARKRYRHYSLGMRQRLALAAALLRPRELLILDEPTNGLDPQGTREVRSLLLDLAAEGTTVLLSTHLLSEVEQICTHVGVMHRGRLVAQDALPALRARTAPVVTVTTPDVSRAARVLDRLGLDAVDLGTDRTGRVTATLGDTRPEHVVAALVHTDVRVRGFEVRTADLEELFVELTGEGFDVSG